MCSLRYSPEKLMNDIKTFDLFFESLVERDLRIYIECLGGKLYHYRDSNGLEIDAIVELNDSEYGIIEIKLGPNEIESAKKNLQKFESLAIRPPLFKCIICGLWDCVVKDPETGIYILPITALKP